MSNLYLRKYRLLIGQAVKNIEDFKVVSPLLGSIAAVEGVQFSQRVEGGNAIEITELKITATINKSSGNTDSTDTTQIEIYNLSPESKKYIQGNNVVVQLYTGYEGDPELQLLYSGYVIKQHTKKSGQDKITTITCADAAIPRVASRVEGSVPPGTSVPDAIKSLIGSYQGVSQGYVYTDSVGDKVFQRGRSFSGYTADELRALCHQYDLLCTYDNGVVNIGPKRLDPTGADITKYRTKAVVITTDLIKGSLEPMDDIANASTAPTEGSKTAIRVNTFLDARLTIDGFMRIQGTEEYDGDYRITSVTHNLDSRGGAWDTTVESEKIA